MASIVVNDLLDVIAAALKNGTGRTALAAYWTTHATNALADASGEINRQLSARGFSAAQIAAWDDLAEFQRNIGLVKALEYGGSLDGFDDKWVKQKKKYFEEVEGTDSKLATCAVLNAGAYQYPADTPGTVGTGAFSGAADMFGTPEDPNDPRIGQVVEF